jgi:hypothetical protein
MYTLTNRSTHAMRADVWQVVRAGGRVVFVVQRCEMVLDIGVCTYTHTHTHIGICTYTHKPKHIDICTYTHTHTHT